MHINAKRPVLVPPAYELELEQLTKAALMDLVWSLASRLSSSAEDEADVLKTVREEWKTVKGHRNSAQSLRARCGPQLSASRRTGAAE